MAHSFSCPPREYNQLHNGTRERPPTSNRNGNTRRCWANTASSTLTTDAKADGIFSVCLSWDGFTLNCLTPHHTVCWQKKELTNLTVLAIKVWIAITGICVDSIFTLAPVLAGRWLTLVTVYTHTRTHRFRGDGWLKSQSNCENMCFNHLTLVTGPERRLEENNTDINEKLQTLGRLLLCVCVCVCLTHGFVIVLEHLPGLLHRAGFFNALPLQVAWLKLFKDLAVVPAQATQHRVGCLLRHKHSS